MERFEQVVDMLFANKIYAKIIHVYCVWYWLLGMCPETGSEGDVYVSSCIETIL